MLIYKDECYAIMGACFAADVPLPLTHRGRTLKQPYRADFVLYDKIIVEIKAVSDLVDEPRAQLLNYLAATGFELGMLLNFRHYPKLEYERLANTHKR